jgi:serpin B
MDATKNLYIKDVIHGAFIDVNEEGTEASAVTVIGLPCIGEMPPVFCADHPFIFLIQDNETGIILFIGRVNNPKEQFVEVHETCLLKNEDVDEMFF